MISSFYLHIFCVIWKFPFYSSVCVRQNVVEDLIYWEQLHCYLNFILQGQPPEDDANDAPPASRFSAVIEKIERLYMVWRMLLYVFFPYMLSLAYLISKATVSTIPEQRFLYYAMPSNAINWYHELSRERIVVMRKIWMMFLTMMNMTLKILS